MTSRSATRLTFVTLVATLIATLALAASSAAAQDNPHGRGRGEHRPPAASENPANSGALQLLPADAVSEHSVDTAHGKIAYTATAGTLAFYGQSGEKIAAVFYVAYIAKDVGANRPLTFVFNGGPGAASAFLNLGLVGPRILDIGRDPARAALHDNPDTWLGFTDLVLIDPIGTGWSRTVKPEDAKHFWGVRSDADAIAKAIALYVDHNNRAAAPKYLLGESYGGLRAAKVARALQRDQGLPIAGIVMLSPLLQGWLTFGDDGSALRAAMQLPSLAAAELERKNAFSREALAAADKFAMTDYLTTLAGALPQGDAAKAFYERVAKVSGLPLAAITRTHGFIPDDYRKDLRAADSKIVSRYDTTFAVDDPFPELLSERTGDPIVDGITRAYGGAMAAYARNELGFKTDMTYILLSGDAARQWDWQGNRSQVDTESDLRVLLAFDPAFHVLIAHGYSDMVTPYAMTRYVIDHLPPIGPPGRVTLKLYRGGHMVYLDAQSRKAFTADAAAFYGAADKK